MYTSMRRIISDINTNNNLKYTTSSSVNLTKHVFSKGVSKQCAP